MIAVLLAAERADLPLERVVSPAVSFRLAASALSELSPFRADFDHNLAWLLARRERVQPFAERLLSAAAATWWWEPMDPDRQVWSRTGGTADHPSAVDVARPTLPVGEARRLWAWENYAHKPSRAIQTSTLGANGETSFLVATHLQVPDIIGPRENIDRSLMPIGRSVRVFEINGPVDWHRLATTHRSEVDLRPWGADARRRSRRPEVVEGREAMGWRASLAWRSAPCHRGRPRVGRRPDQAVGLGERADSMAVMGLRGAGPATKGVSLEQSSPP